MPFKLSEPGKAISLQTTPVLPTIALYFSIFMWTDVKMSQIDVEQESPLRKLDWNDNDVAGELPREVASPTKIPGRSKGGTLPKNACLRGQQLRQTRGKDRF